MSQTARLKLETKRFGTIEIDADRAFTFPEGVPGLAGHRFGLVPDPKSTLAGWLQSIEDPGLALVVVDPVELALDYVALPKQAELRPILPDNEPIEKLMRRVIVRA